MSKKSRAIVRHKKFLIASLCIVLVAILCGLLIIIQDRKNSSKDINVSSQSYTIEPPANVSVSDVFQDISTETGLSRDMVVTATLSLMVGLMLPILFIVFRPRHNFEEPTYNEQFMSKKPSGYLEELRQMEMKREAEIKKRKQTDVIAIS